MNVIVNHVDFSFGIQPHNGSVMCAVFIFLHCIRRSYFDIPTCEPSFDGILVLVSATFILNKILNGRYMSRCERSLGKRYNYNYFWTRNPHHSA